MPRKKDQETVGLSSSSDSSPKARSRPESDPFHMNLRRRRSSQLRDSASTVMESPAVNSSNGLSDPVLSDSTLSSVPSDIDTPSPLKRRRQDDDQSAIAASASPKLGPRKLNTQPPSKKARVSFDEISEKDVPAYRTRGQAARTMTSAANGFDNLRASTPASVASSSPMKGGRGGRGGSRGGGRPGKNGRDGKDRGGKGKKERDDPKWPHLNRELLDTEETLALKKRRHELRSFFKQLATVHVTAMEVLASRDLSKIVRKKDYHTTVPGYDETIETLQEKLKEREEILKTEYDIKVQLEMNELAQKKELIEEQFKDQARNCLSEHLSFAKRDLQQTEQMMRAADDDDHTVVDLEDYSYYFDPLQIRPQGENRSTRGYNSNTVRRMLPAAYGSYNPQDFEEHVRRQVMFTDVIRPILDRDQREKAGAAERGRIAAENLRLLTEAAASEFGEQLSVPTQPQPNADTTVYAVDLSRLADAAEEVRKSQKTPPRRRAKRADKNQVSDTTQVNGTYLPPPPPTAPVTRHRRQASKPTLQPSPMLGTPPSASRYPPIQASPISKMAAVPYPNGHSPFHHEPPQLPPPHQPPPQQFHHHHFVTSPAHQAQPTPINDTSPFRIIQPNNGPYQISPPNAITGKDNSTPAAHLDGHTFIQPQPTPQLQTQAQYPQLQQPLYPSMLPPIVTGQPPPTTPTRTTSISSSPSTITVIPDTSNHTPPVTNTGRASRNRRGRQGTPGQGLGQRGNGNDYEFRMVTPGQKKGDGKGGRKGRATAKGEPGKDSKESDK